ncbi:MAG: hypothetical protein K2I42_06805, partial [Anaeroplasmataceae bacterium]|nr:hypothetical protein [Anaeroplasmataceae bacterium]
MNEKIVLKIARHLINSIYTDLSKTEILDKVYNDKTNDIDCKIILNNYLIHIRIFIITYTFISLWS